MFKATCDSLSHEFAKEMKHIFEMSMSGELNFFIDIQNKQSENGIFISQSKYVRDMVKKFDMKKEESCLYTYKHMCQNQLRFYRTGKCVNSTLYRSMIWSLLYITICTLNIAFSVGVCTIFQFNSKKSHLTTIKKI